MKRPAMTQGSVSENDDLLTPVQETLVVAVEQDQRRQPGRSDRVALRDRLRRVADRVERVGDAAHAFGQVGHLGDAARVVRHRAVGVERDDEPRHRELRHDRDADAVDVLAGGVVGADDAGRDDHDRKRGRLHPDGEALDDVRRVPRLRRLRDVLHGLQRVPV